jgi:hypothetical protein
MILPCATFSFLLFAVKKDKTTAVKNEDNARTICIKIVVTILVKQKNESRSQPNPTETYQCFIKGKNEKNISSLSTKIKNTA